MVFQRKTSKHRTDSLLSKNFQIALDHFPVGVAPDYKLGMGGRERGSVGTIIDMATDYR